MDRTSILETTPEISHMLVHRFGDLQSACSPGRILRAAGLSVGVSPVQRSNGNEFHPMVTHLIFEERIPDIFCHSGHSQSIVLTFLVSLGADAVEERAPIFPNQPESAERESA